MPTPPLLTHHSCEVWEAALCLVPPEHSVGSTQAPHVLLSTSVYVARAVCVLCACSLFGSIRPVPAR